MSKYIKKLIEQGEHQQLDFKFEISDSRKIARTLVAFTNTKGGKILVGVKDNGVIAGIRSDEEYYMIEAAATLYSRPEVKFTTREWDIDGKIVLEVDIPPSNHRPHLAPYKDNLWKAYIRVDDQNLLANRILLKTWELSGIEKNVTIRYREEEKFLMEYLEKKNRITFSQFCRIGGIPRQKAETILINFILLKIITMEITEKQVYYRIAETNS
ncbi:MAG: ATP-binding protein [Bacteroidetes bacterium]|nr:ATP-binding protein [Bacteroidota bacterium]